jgi:hypothetical protein
MSEPLALTMTIEEAASQLAEAQAEVEKIRERIGQVQAQGSAVQAATKELADALLRGDDVSTIAMPRLNSAQVRHAVQALEGALADAKARVSQATSALRRAKVERLKALLDEAKTEYDRQALELVARYADVHALCEKLASITGIDSRPGSWHNLTIPRAIPANVGGIFFDGSVLVSRGLDVVTQAPGAAAAVRLAQKLKQEGIE